MGLMSASHHCRAGKRPSDSRAADAVRAHTARLVKATLTAVVTISATAVIGAANAGTATAAAPPSAASGAALPDIVGLRPAIPAQQAYDFLKAYDRAAHVYVSATPLGAPPISPKPFPYQLALAQDPNTPTEVISVSLTLPPLKASVWRISRLTAFEVGKAPTVENVVASLRAKYGPEAILIGNANMAANSKLAWYFDEAGKRVERPGGLSPASCAGQLGPTDEAGILADNHNLAYTLLQPLDDRQGVRECRAVIVVSAQMAPGSTNFRVVGRLRVTVADLPLEARAHAATLAWIAKGKAAEAEQESQREDEVAPPKL
jgi:hypothetical protein